MSTVINATWHWLLKSRFDIRSWEHFSRRDMAGQRIAVVGNAGYLTKLEQGPQIDAHDLVLRMNNYVTGPFAPQVGSRTDIWMTTFHNDVALERVALQEVPFIMTSVPFNFTKDKAEGLNYRHGVAISRGLKTLRRRTAYTVSAAFFRRYYRAIGRYPTTGALTIALVAELLVPSGMSAYLTGFSFFEGASHYFSDAVVKVRNHDLQREREILRGLLEPHLQSGRIQLDDHMAKHLGARQDASQPAPSRWRSSA